MPQPDRSALSYIPHVGGLALAFGLASVALADNSIQWRLEANVPVICAVLDVEASADRPTGLAIATTCNAERYQLVLHQDSGQAGLRAARSSAGPVQISGSAVNITSTRPGYALTTVELTAPVSPEHLSVTLRLI
jgi:hypothetical protein